MCNIRHNCIAAHRLIVLNDDEISLLNIGFGFADIRSHVNELLHNPRRSIRAQVCALRARS